MYYKIKKKFLFHPCKCIKYMCFRIVSARTDHTHHQPLNANKCSKVARLQRPAAIYKIAVVVDSQAAVLSWNICWEQLLHKLINNIARGARKLIEIIVQHIHLFLYVFLYDDRGIKNLWYLPALNTAILCDFAV